MKRRKVKQIFIIFMLLALSGLSCLFLFLNYGGYLYIDKEIKNRLVKEIENSPNLPNRFYEMYDLVYPNSLERNVVTQYFLNGKGCPYSYISYESALDANVPLIIFAAYLENFVSQKQCLNYYT